MARSDQDRYQKEMAIRYAVATDQVPFLEVLVPNKSEISDVEKRITDIDVMAIDLRHDGSIKKTIIDCKDRNKMSAINRSFWAAGLMQYTSSDQSIVILRNTPEEAHRLSAKQINVQLFDETNFISFARSQKIDFDKSNSYCSDIENWHKFEDIFLKWKVFSDIGTFMNCNVPLTKEYDKTFRGLISHLRHIRGELDPKKNEHMALYSNAVFCITFCISPLVNDFKNVFDPRHDRKQFESMLRYFIWGGRESYLLRLKLKYNLSGGNNDTVEFELREWNRFLELFRTLLEAPTLIPECCLPAKEISFRNLDEISEEKDLRVKELLTKNKRIRQFLFSISEYTMRATGIPPEMHEQYENSINEIM
ncbi:MAG: hypothetical protein HWE30_18605 [Methylocystaceae bacterium]|nr:hypothetical protein [Methylocystaceae bacterium]